ncbi:MAG: hypothetical protein Q7S12_03575 [bacterium]|nr:hypothetical protein [bacterium]
MLASYLVWHYGAGAREAWERAMLAIRGVYNYFSLRYLLGSLFAPFHRDTQSKGLGFDPQVFFMSIAENLVSRVVGFCIRIFIIFFGLIAMFFTVLGAMLFYLGWFAAPAAAVLFIFTGFLMFF